MSLMKLPAPNTSAAFATLNFYLSYAAAQLGRCCPFILTIVGWGF